MRGVRYTAVPECPAPISEPLKQLLWIKRVPAARVAHPADPAIGLPFLSDAAGSQLLQQATAQTSWPVLFHEDERPRTAWLEQLELVERLGAAGTPALFPKDPAHHAAMVGMVHLIMGERGFFWMRRLLHVSAREPGGVFEQKYSAEGDLAAAPGRVLELLRHFDAVLQRQEASGSHYLVGDALSAADVYWAFASMLCITPPPELIAPDKLNGHFGEAMPARTAMEFLHVFAPTNGPFDVAVTPRLRAHQEHIVRTHCNFPLK